MNDMYDDEFFEQEDEDIEELQSEHYFVLEPFIIIFIGYEKELLAEDIEAEANKNGDEDKNNGEKKQPGDELDKDNVLMPKSSIPISNKLNLKDK